MACGLSVASGHPPLEPPVIFRAARWNPPMVFWPACVAAMYSIYRKVVYNKRLCCRWMGEFSPLSVDQRRTFEVIMVPQSCNFGRLSRTKIVATVGPACARVDQLVGLIESGADVFRINTAHGSREEHKSRVESIRLASRHTGVPVAILVDLAGPKIRLGELPGGEFQCLPGQNVCFVRGAESQVPGELTTTYHALVDELEVGDKVVLADGLVSLVVVDKRPDAAVCQVVQGGTVRSRQGVNLPGVKLKVPPMTERDMDNAAWAAAAGADFIGLSFVRSPDDLVPLREIIARAAASSQIVAKIEKPEAVAYIEPIVDAADAIMIARGDLGVEIDIAQMPVVQKRIIQLCKRACKPVIVATQMLESMHNSRLPTRAEATDVVNAILDGTDACMLSGETAVGQYPQQAVEMIHRIALATESLLRQQHRQLAQPAFHSDPEHPITQATTWAAGLLAEQLEAKLLVVATASGRTALSISKQRRFVYTIGLSDQEATLRRMCLYWGVVPVRASLQEDIGEVLQGIIGEARAAGRLQTNDRVVMIGGTGLPVSRHNMIVVHELP